MSHLRAELETEHGPELQRPSAQRWIAWVHAAPGKPRDWYEDYNRQWGLRLGADCCAPDSVSFHYVKKPAMMRHIHALLYDCEGTGAGQASFLQ